MNLRCRRLKALEIFFYKKILKFTKCLGRLWYINYDKRYWKLRRDRKRPWWRSPQVNIFLSLVLWQVWKKLIWVKNPFEQGLWSDCLKGAEIKSLKNWSYEVCHNPVVLARAVMSWLYGAVAKVVYALDWKSREGGSTPPGSTISILMSCMTR